MADVKTIDDEFYNAKIIINLDGILDKEWYSKEIWNFSNERKKKKLKKIIKILVSHKNKGHSTFISHELIIFEIRKGNGRIKRVGVNEYRYQQKSKRGVFK